jgi:hypothetical protein
LVCSAIPCFDGNFDPRAYIEWELKVEKEFEEHDLSKVQMIYIASYALTEYALLEWKYICWHNNIPQNCIDKMSFVMCSAMSNFGQNKKDLATQPIEVESEKGKSICAELNHVNDETHSLTMPPCEPITLVLNLSTTSASLEQSLVEPVTQFPLLQDGYKIVPCDREKLCHHASLISTT